MTAKYNNVLHRSTNRKRADGVTGMFETGDILPFCVGIAAQPTRMQVFKNEMTCDKDGFKTLFVFTAHTEHDSFLAPNPVCVGVALNPNRNTFFSNTMTCTNTTWNTSFVFYQSAKIFQQVAMWQARDPQRMIIYPAYRGNAHGWTVAQNLQYRTHFRLAPIHEMQLLNNEYPGHVEVIMLLTVSSTSDTATKRCATLMIANAYYPFIPIGSGFSHAGSATPDFVKGAAEVGCSQLVPMTRFHIKRVFVGDYGSFEVIIGNKTYAAVTMKVGPETRLEFLQVALLESMRVGQPVMIALNSSQSSDYVVAKIQCTAVVIGDPAKIYMEPIPM